MFLTNKKNIDSQQVLDSQRRGKSMSYINNNNNVYRHPHVCLNNRYQKKFQQQSQNEPRDKQQNRLNSYPMKMPVSKYRLPWIKQEQATMQADILLYNDHNHRCEIEIFDDHKLPYKQYHESDCNSDEYSEMNQVIRHAQNAKKFKYSKQPWMIVENNQDDLQNYEIKDKKINKLPINHMNFEILNMKNNDPDNLWKSKVNKKQSYIILNYLNGVVNKKKKESKSKTKKRSTSLHQINNPNSTNQSNNQNSNQNNQNNNQNNLNNNQNNIIYNGHSKSVHKIQPLKSYHQSSKTQMKKYLSNNNNSLLDSNIQPNFIRTKNIKRNCIGNQNKHKRLLSSILLKQQLTLQKQQKLIVELKNKVQQFQYSKNLNQFDNKQIKNLIIRKSPKRLNVNKLPLKRQYQNIQKQHQPNKNQVKIINNYRTSFQSIQKSLNLNNIQQKQLIISHKTKEQMGNNNVYTLGYPQVQQTGVNTYIKLKTLSSSNSICNSNRNKKSTITSRITQFDQKKQKVYQKSPNLSAINRKMNQTKKQLKVQKRQKPKTNYPLRVPQLNFLKIQTYYSLIANRKNDDGNEVKKGLFQNSLITSPINRSPKKRPQIKDQEFVKNYLSCQIPKDQIQLKKFIDSYHPLSPTLNFQQLFMKLTFQIILDPQKHLYFGELNQNKIRHGYGIYLQKNYIYQGLWENNQKLYGIQVNQSGYYKGEFKNNKKEGKGQFKWQNKQYYNGDWMNGKKHGNGIWSSPNQDHYVGEWFQGKVQGQGIHTSFNGQQYEGSFKNFLKSGWGKEHLPNGDSYQGDFIGGQPHGKGIYRWINGEIYQGQFKNSLRQFYGIFKDVNYNQYRGQFNNQQATGLCQINFANGDQYEGNIQNGLFNGNGKLKLAGENQIWNGSWLNGQFVENL